ncbi:MAG: hypothetical protein KC616_15310 [Myxococcales bacterium]|nr:hypothetical protein [Myxococcales bacterium]
MTLPHEDKFRLRLPILASSFAAGLALSFSNAPGKPFPFGTFAFLVAMYGAFFFLAVWCFFALVDLSAGKTRTLRFSLLIFFYFFSAGAVASVAIGVFEFSEPDDWFAMGMMLPVAFSIAGACYLRLSRL